MFKSLFRSTARWVKGIVSVLPRITVTQVSEDDVLIADVASLVTNILTPTHTGTVPPGRCYRVGCVRDGVLVVTQEGAAFWAKNKRVIYAANAAARDLVPGAPVVPFTIEDREIEICANSIGYYGEENIE